jgi:CRP-like cAMP-binding protein
MSASNSGRGASFFSALTPRELQLLDRKCPRMPFARGDFLFRSGDPVTGIYRILEGIVKFTQPTGTGKALTVRFATPGGSAGYRSVFTSQTYRGSAIAKEAVEAQLISSEVLLKLFQSNRAFALFLIRQIARDLDRTEQRLLEFQKLGLPSRLIALLRSLDEQFGNDAGPWRQLSIRLSKVELAELVGASVETVVRQLSRWKRDGLIEEKGKRISISPRLLRRIIRQVSSVGQNGFNDNGSRVPAEEFESPRQGGPKLPHRRSTNAQA